MNREDMSIKDWLRESLQDVMDQVAEGRLEPAAEIQKDEVYKIMDRYRRELVDFLTRQPAWFYGREEKDDAYRRIRANVTGSIMGIKLEVGR